MLHQTIMEIGMMVNQLEISMSNWRRSSSDLETSFCLKQATRVHFCDDDDDDWDWTDSGSAGV